MNQIEKWESVKRLNLKLIVTFWARCFVRVIESQHLPQGHFAYFLFYFSQPLIKQTNTNTNLSQIIDPLIPPGIMQHLQPLFPRLKVRFTTNIVLMNSPNKRIQFCSAICSFWRLITIIHLSSLNVAYIILWAYYEQPTICMLLRKMNRSVNLMYTGCYRTLSRDLYFKGN